MIEVNQLPQQIQDAVAKLTPNEELAEIARGIEGSPQESRNHYVRYMAILHMAQKRSGFTGAVIFGLALINNGANKQGVNDALKLLANGEK